MKGFAFPRQFRQSTLAESLSRNMRELVTFVNSFVVRFDEGGENVTLPGDLTVAGDVTVTGVVTDSSVAGPLGLITTASITANVAGITTVADVTGLSVTWTAAASRRYKITAFTRLTKDATAHDVTVYITDGSNNIKAGGTTSLGASWQSNPTLHEIVTPGAGSVTRKVRAVSGGGAVTVSASSTAPSLIFVEDVGAA